MARFYFSIVECEESVLDSEGEEFPGTAEAIAEAFVIASELGQDEDHHGCIVVVKNEDGSEIIRLLVTANGPSLLQRLN